MKQHLHNLLAQCLEDNVRAKFKCKVVLRWPNVLGQCCANVGIYAMMYSLSHHQHRVYEKIVGLMLAQRLHEVIKYYVGAVLPENVGPTEAHYALIPCANDISQSWANKRLHSTNVGPT